MAEAVRGVGVVTPTRATTSATTRAPTAPAPAWLPPRLLLDEDPPPLKPIQRPAAAAPAAAPAAALAAAPALDAGRVEPRVNLAAVRRLRELGGVVLGEETASVWRWAGDSLPLPREMPGERGWG